MRDLVPELIWTGLVGRAGLEKDGLGGAGLRNVLPAVTGLTTLGAETLAAVGSLPT